MISLRKFKRIAIFVLVLIITFVQFSVTMFGKTKISKEESVLKSKIIVSMGDSFSAGEGIEKFYGQEEQSQEKVKNQDWLAHRSTKSWPGQLMLPAVSEEKTMSNYRSENWYFVATSGAETKHIKGSFEKKYDYDDLSGSRYIDPQINVFRELGDKKADYVTLTMGGNDAGFADIIETAAMPHPFNPSALSDKINAVWTNYYKEGGIRDNLRKAYSDISYEAGPQAKIIVAGYPKLINPKGSGGLFSKEDAMIINNAVTNFNKEIETLVNSCKASGMKICFVSVEEAFDGYEAYCENECLNRVKFKQKEDIDQGKMISSYSIHPNEEGAKKYASCVQKKIDEIEKDGGKSEWPLMVGSEERDAVAVLDVSGSMAGTPLNETKNAANAFVNTILYEDVGIGMVVYDDSAMRMADFNKNPVYLKNVIDRLNSGGGTNIEAGLVEADNMLSESGAKKKFIVLMSDGEPNRGKTDESLVEYANSIKKKGVRIYTLGFFASLSSKTNAQTLMERIASDGCHFEVDDASQLMFFFDDIAEQIKGTKYFYIRIACPVDVSVEYDGEILSSKGKETTQRTKFGTLTFEEGKVEEEYPNSGYNYTYNSGFSSWRPNDYGEHTENEESTDNRVKIFRLKEGTNYNIHIEGNGRGKMDYTVAFMDADGNYSDVRKFEDIGINRKTRIDTVVSNSASTSLKVDSDGDGGYEYIYKAGKNDIGSLVDYKERIAILLLPMMLLGVLLLALKLRKELMKKRLETVAVGGYEVGASYSVGSMGTVPTSHVLPTEKANTEKVSVSKDDIVYSSVKPEFFAVPSENAITAAPEEITVKKPDESGKNSDLSYFKQPDEL